MKRIKIKNKFIGNDYPIFFIAEAGVNHNGSLKLAKKLIDVAKSSGADAVKFQSFFAEEIILPNAPKSTYHIETTGNDKKQTWMELLKTQEISKSMLKKLINYSNKKNIIFLSTPYDEKSVDLLDSCNVPAYKVASTDTNNHKLLIHMAKKRKPIIISTAMSTEEEVKASVKLLIKHKAKHIILMQCTGSYPTKPKDSNLNVLKNYKNIFGDKCLYGYSDHTEDFINPIAASAIGISAYEKHFTLNKKMPGPDHRMSLSPKELKKTITLVRETELALGSYKKEVLKCEIENRKKLKKSLVANQDILKGKKIKNNYLTSKRPGFGIAPSDILKIIGLKAKNNIKKNTILKRSMFI
jgi:N,N'-diacetyllegionaminate synthase